MGRKQEDTALNITENHEIDARKKKKNNSEAKHKRKLEETEAEVVLDAKKEKKKKNKEKRQKEEQTLNGGLVFDCAEGSQTLNGSDEVSEKKKKKKHKGEKEQECLGKEFVLGCAEVSENLNGSDEISKKKKKKKQEEETEIKSLDNGVVHDDDDVKRRKSLNGSRKNHDESNENDATVDGGHREDYGGVVVYGKDIKEPKYAALSSFAESALPKEVLECCKNFDKPSPIQSHSWPFLLEGRDLIGIAATGSGNLMS